MPVVRSSGDTPGSVTVTMLLVPLSDNAVPTLPGTGVAAVMVPLRALGEESIAVVPPASSKVRARTTFAGPDETTNATLLPGGTKLFAPGDWLMMFPRLIVELL